MSQRNLKAVKEDALERTVAVAGLLRPEALDEIQEVLPDPSGALKNANYAALLETQLAIRQRGEPVDPITVSNELPEEVLRDLGGISGLADLTSGVMTANIPHYARELKKLATRRHIERYARQLTSAASNGLPYEDVIALIQKGFKDFGVDAASGLTFNSLSNWRDIAQAPTQFIFQNLLPAFICACVAAPGGMGKSFLLLVLAIHLITGKTLLPSFVPARPMKVIILFGEDSLKVVLQRIYAIAFLFDDELSHEELDDALLKNLRLFCGSAYPLVEVDNGKVSPTAFYRRLAQEARTADVIIIDPLSKFHGLPSENDNALASQFMNYLQALCGGNQATVLFSHHVNKVAMRSREAAIQASPRGASAFIDESRWAASLQVFDEKLGKNFKIEQGREWQHLRLEIFKDNYSTGHHDPIYLKRFEGGALAETNIVESRLRRIAVLIQNWISTGGEPLPKTAITEDTRTGKAKYLQDHLNDEFGGTVTRRDRRDAVEFGLQQRILLVEPDGQRRMIHPGVENAPPF